MTTAKNWFSAAELAALPGMPGTSRGVIKAAQREGWEWRKRERRGGGREYALRALPKETREALLAQMVQAAREPRIPEVFSQDQIPLASELKDWQRRRAEARAALVQEVKRLASAAGTEKAIQAVIGLAAAGELPEYLQRLVPAANAKVGESGSRTLCRRTLYRWMKDAEQGFAALAPKAKQIDVPAWAPALLKLYGQPQKPSLKKCLEDLSALLPTGVAAPSYWAANRFLNKVSKVDAQRGRMGPREIKSIRPFVRRDTSHMWPTDCYTADGHTFDAEVAHPAHGRPFRPEMTSVLDIATRKCVGWSAGLAEATWTVLDALRNGVETCGIPALFYVDNGSGFKNAMMADEAVGFLARIGTTPTHSLPYNSQARGLEERSHKTIFVRSAKELPTYMGADMDREARQKIYKLTRANIKATGASRLLKPWAEFLAWCQEKVDAYNSRPHSALPKIADPITGKKRHQTPNEAWEAARKEGWEPVEVTQEEAVDLFRPYKECKVIRAEVRLFTNTYFHPDLEHYHGETLRVGYDIHDPSRVWVRDREGRLICVAEFEGNKRHYFPVSVIEQAAQRRAAGRIKRAEAKIEEAEAELNPPLQIEHQQTEYVDFTPDFSSIDKVVGARVIQGVSDEMDETAVTAREVAQPENVVGLSMQARRPRFTTEPEKFRWLMGNKEEWTSQDADWLLEYIASEQYADLLERYAFQGIAWTQADEMKARKMSERGFEVATR